MASLRSCLLAITRNIAFFSFYGCFGNYFVNDQLEEFTLTCRFVLGVGTVNDVYDCLHFE